MTPKTEMTEQAEGRAYLEGARDRVRAAVAGLSEAQWSYRPAAGGWSIAGILEHMVVVQELVLGPVAQGLAETPETASGDAATIDAILKAKLADRSRKFQGPELACPAGRWTPAESLERFEANTRGLIERLETPGLRQHRVPAAPLKAISDGAYELMDGYQWILAAALHTDRHTGQILEVKGEAGFPAN